MRVVILLLLTCGIASAQTTASELRHKYGQPVSETYNVRPDVTVTVTYAKSGAVCELLIKPSSKSETGKPPLLKSQPLNAVIDELVPTSQRGKYLMAGFVNIFCMPDGGCEGTEESYERLTIFRNGGTDAHRFASITWKRNACENPQPPKMPE